jgi:hypothetical protein
MFWLPERKIIDLAPVHGTRRSLQRLNNILQLVRHRLRKTCYKHVNMNSVPLFAPVLQQLTFTSIRPAEVGGKLSNYERGLCSLVMRHISGTGRLSFDNEFRVSSALHAR